MTGDPHGANGAGLEDGAEVGDDGGGPGDRAGSHR
jgi:hypothetical protein